MTEQELKEADERLTVAKRMFANIQHVERHLETMGTLFSNDGDLDAMGLKTVLRGLEVIRPGTHRRISAALVSVVASLVGELRVEFEKA